MFGDSIVESHVQTCAPDVHKVCKCMLGNSLKEYFNDANLMSSFRRTSLLAKGVGDRYRVHVLQRRLGLDHISCGHWLNYAM